MTTATVAASNKRKPEMDGQMVVLIGGSSGIGFDRRVEPGPNAPL